jgi:hypothetical protein
MHATAPPGAVGVSPSPPATERYLTAAEVAALLRATDQSVRSWATAGCRCGNRVVTLASIAGGRRYLFRAEDVARFVTDCTAAREAARLTTHAGDRPAAAEADDGYAEAMAALGRPVA